MPGTLIVRAYPDTSFLYAFYLKQSNSQAAAAYAATMGEPLHVTELLQYEFRQSLRFQAWRHAFNADDGIALADAQEALNKFERDLESGIAVLAPCSLAEVFSRAEDLSNRHTITGGHRIFDVLQVAAALVLGAEDFVTFDVNQRKLAQAEGLSIKP
jgi:predicted nucleic acid-binding protein